MTRMMLVQSIEHPENENVFRNILRDHFTQEEFDWIVINIAAAYIFIENLPHGFEEQSLIKKIEAVPETTVWLITENNNGSEEIIWWHGSTPNRLGQALQKYDHAVKILHNTRK